MSDLWEFPMNTYPYEYVHAYIRTQKHHQKPKLNADMQSRQVLHT